MIVIGLIILFLKISFNYFSWFIEGWLLCLF